MNREWVTLAFGVALVSGVVVVSVWQNSPGRSQDGAAPAAGSPTPEPVSPTPAPPEPTAVSSTPEAEASRSAAPTAAPPPRVDARVPVVHKHRFGDCEGTLRAAAGMLTYSTTHKEDGFRLAFADIDEFALDEQKKNLRIRRRGGRTWNFTTRDGAGTTLVAFHRDASKSRR